MHFGWARRLSSRSKRCHTVPIRRDCCRLAEGRTPALVRGGASSPPTLPNARPHYSIILLARASSDDDPCEPKRFGGLKITSSNVVGGSVGRSSGRAPLRIRSTVVAARRKASQRARPVVQ